MGPLALPVVLYCQEFGYWLSLLYSTVSNWISQLYFTVSNWATGSPCCTLLSVTGPLVLPLELFCHVWGHWLSLLYSTVRDMGTGSPCCTPPSMYFLLYDLQLTYWSSLLYSTFMHWAVCCPCCSLLSGLGSRAYPVVLYGQVLKLCVCLCV